MRYRYHIAYQLLDQGVAAKGRAGGGILARIVPEGSGATERSSRLYCSWGRNTGMTKSDSPTRFPVV